MYEQVDSPAGYRESVETPENVVQQDWNPKLISEYYKWLKNKIKDRTKWKPNAERRLWIKFVKAEGRRPPNSILMPEYDERLWMMKLQEAVLQCIGRKLTIINFLVFKYPNLQFALCRSPTGDLTQEEKQRIIEEGHDNFSSQHFEENKSILCAENKGVWKNIEDDIIKFIKNALLAKNKSLLRLDLKLKRLFLILLWSLTIKFLWTSLDSCLWHWEKMNTYFPYRRC